MSAPTSEPRKKPSLTIDGVVVEFEPGDTIMKAAERVNLGAAIPRFCYHPALPISGTCRMCTVEIEKSPKLMTSCSTPAADGMIVHTQSDKVQKSRNGVMEFLLINHPLDCPVCDQAGECSLQDYNYEYGPGSSRYKEDKRVWDDSTTTRLSSEITLNMNRCVHCERCVRFTDEVTKTSELLMTNRSWKKELVTAGEKGLNNDYQGNLAEICPVGALTFNDFRFKKRVWFLEQRPSICDRCSKGCNIEVDHQKNVPYRYRARFNQEVNGHWLCDEGRKSYHDFTDDNRITVPMLAQGNDGSLHPTSWADVASATRQTLASAKSVLVVFGTDCTMEEVELMRSQLGRYTQATVTWHYYNGTADVVSSKDDKPLDHLLRRRDHTPNTRGLESLGLTPYQSSDASKYDVAIMLRHGRAGIPAQRMGRTEIAWGMWTNTELLGRHFIAVLPGAGTLEKAGTFINCDGVKQTFPAALKPRGESKTVGEVLGLLVSETASHSNLERARV